MKKKISRKEVFESLMQQLAQKGGSVECFEDMVARYMQYWDIEKKLLADIRKRGITYEDVSSVGVKMMKNNPSVKEAVMVNRQMLMILKELGLSAVEAGAGGGDEGDL